MKFATAADDDGGVGGMVVFPVSRPHTFVTSDWRRSSAYYIMNASSWLLLSLISVARPRELSRFRYGRTLCDSTACGRRFPEWFLGRTPRSSRRESSGCPPESSFFDLFTTVSSIIRIQNRNFRLCVASRTHRSFLYGTIIDLNFRKRRRTFCFYIPTVKQSNIGKTPPVIEIKIDSFDFRTKKS